MPIQRVHRAATFTFCLSWLFLAGLSAGCHKKTSAPQPQEVQFITATPTNVPIFEEWIGTLDGFVNAQIRAQVTGYLQTQNYAEGSEVKKGDLMFQIDPRPFQAALDQAKAKLAQDKAQAARTELDVKRYGPLAKEQAVSQQEMDNAVQNNLSAIAQVHADEANVTNAELNLGFTKITSPIDGIAGTAQAQIGDLLSQSSGVLTTVSTVRPIRVYFQASEESYLTFWHRLATGASSEDFPLQLILGDGSIFPEKGHFFYADRQVNPNTGTLQIFGLFSNLDLLLRPGQYGRVRAQTQVRTNVIVLPQRAVAELQGSYQVTVLGSTNEAHIRPVTVGTQIPEGWIIEKGLNPGDRVVVEGTQKAKEGTVVNPKPYTGQTNDTQQANNAGGSGTGAAANSNSK
jgi:membrane fusion protein (multidrug efflux system)